MHFDINDILTIWKNVLQNEIKLEIILILKICVYYMLLSTLYKVYTYIHKCTLWPKLCHNPDPYIRKTLQKVFFRPEPRTTLVRPGYSAAAVVRPHQENFRFAGGEKLQSGWRDFFFFLWYKDFRNQSIRYIFVADTHVAVAERAISRRKRM